MTYNRKQVFKAVRNLTRRLDQEQVDNLNHIVNSAEKHNISPKHLAYMLATAWHEARFKNIRETFAKTDTEAAQRLNRMYPRKIGTKRQYWRKQPNGKRFFGRGLGAQITWVRNYRLAGEKLGLDLYNHPELVLKGDVGAEILVRGLKEGWFTGKKLSDFMGFYSMRRVVNGTDKAKTIARYANTLWGPLVAAHKDTAPVFVPSPAPVVIPPPEHNLPMTVTVTMKNGDTFIFERSESTLTAFDAPWEESHNEPELVQFETEETKMTQTKSAFASKTIWGALIMVATTVGPPILTKFGLNDWATALSTGNYMTIFQLAASAMVVYGRDQALSKLRWPKVSF